MPRPRISARDPFDVHLSEEQTKDLAIWLSDEIQAALDARATIIQPGGDLDYAAWLYEQGKSAARAGRWEGAADLTSYIVSEKVDALRARITKTIFVEPVWTVEGWGKDAERAPFVEEFHQWKQEDERTQQYLSKTIHNALLEGTGVLEVVDRADRRLVRQLQQLAAQTADDGTLLLGDDGKPQAQMDEQGIPVPAQDGGATLEAATATYRSVRKGPGYRVVSLRDFLFLPGHAADKAELFGYAKRCWLRWSQLQERAKQGYYSNIDKLSSLSDRDSVPPSLARTGLTLAEQRGDTVEKELWEVQILKDLDGDGIEEWYLATVSVVSREIIRLKHDDLGHPRYIDITPFPRTDSLYGYIFALDKLGTIAEEHTSIRNMIADRSLLATIPPMKRLQGALWDPQEQPFGTASVIDVRDMNEVQPMEIPDVPSSAVQREMTVLQAAERVAGVNDVASGQRPTEQRTLGEVQLVTEQSFVRMDEVVKNIQESLETLWLVRHELWIRTLQDQPNGMEPPETVIRSIQTRGLEIENGRFTANLLRGNFRGKPHGSVETADIARLRGDFNASLTALAGMAKMNQVFAGLLQHPRAAKAIIEQWARLYHVGDRQAFIAAFDEVTKAIAIQQQQQAEQAQQQAQMQALIPAQGGVTAQGAPGRPGPPPPSPRGPQGPPQGGVPPQVQALLSRLSDEQLNQLEARGGAGQ